MRSSTTNNNITLGNPPFYILPLLLRRKIIWGPFHKSLYEQFFLYEFIEPELNYGSNEFVALTNLCETGPWIADVCIYTGHSLFYTTRITLLLIVQSLFINPPNIWIKIFQITIEI